MWFRCPQGPTIHCAPTLGAQMAMPRASQSLGRQQVALHCHPTGHTWLCTVTNMCSTELSMQGMHMALPCPHGD